MNGTKSGNKSVVPESREALDSMKAEVAQEMGINLKKGYNGDLSARDSGRVGGEMVKRMVESYEKSRA